MFAVKVDDSTTVHGHYNKVELLNEASSFL